MKIVKVWKGKIHWGRSRSKTTSFPHFLSRKYVVEFCCLSARYYLNDWEFNLLKTCFDKYLELSFRSIDTCKRWRHSCQKTPSSLFLRLMFNFDAVGTRSVDSNKVVCGVDFPSDLLRKKRSAVKFGLTIFGLTPVFSSRTRAQIWASLGGQSENVTGKYFRAKSSQSWKTWMPISKSEVFSETIHFIKRKAVQ